MSGTEYYDFLGSFMSGTRYNDGSGWLSFSEMLKKREAERKEKARRERRNLLREKRNSLRDRLKRLDQTLQERPNLAKKCNSLRERLGLELVRLDQELGTYSVSDRPSNPHCYPSQQYGLNPLALSFNVGDTSNQSGVSPSSASSSGSGRSYEFAYHGAEDELPSTRSNPGETSEGANLRNEELDEVTNQRGIPEMGELCSAATDSTLPISSGGYEFAGDVQARILGRAQDLPLGPYLNRQEISNRGDSVIEKTDDDFPASLAMPDNCGGEDVHLSPRFNPGETSEGASLKNEVLDEVANQRRIPEMRDLRSGPTNSTFSTSSGRYESAGEGPARILGRAQDMPQGPYLNRQEISNRGDTAIGITDDDHPASPAMPDNCGAKYVHLSPRFNPGETSEGTSLRNEVLDEVANQRGIPEMRDLCSGATTSIFSISSGRYESASDRQARNLGRAQDMPPGPYLTRQEISNRGDAAIRIADPASPAMPDNRSRETKFPTESNNIIVGITAQAAFALISSCSSSSPFLRFFAVATGIGFLGSFYAKFILKKPELARILYKVGAVGSASAVIFALGSYLPRDPQWELITMVATWAMVVFTAMVVGMA